MLLDILFVILLLTSFPVSLAVTDPKNIFSVEQEWHTRALRSNSFIASNHSLDNLLVPFSALSKKQEFEIQSHVSLPRGLTWCLEAQFSTSNNVIYVLAAWCNGSQHQKWFLDQSGLLRSVFFPEHCPSIAQRSVVLLDCTQSSFQKMWIYSSDSTIRMNTHTVRAMNIRPNFLKPRKLNKRRSKVSWANIINRQPEDNEKWEIVPHVLQTPSPTFAPTSSIHFKEPVTPSVAPSQMLSNFNIALVNMGNITTFDTSFQRAKRKWETLIVGDVIDHPSIPDESFDWFGNTWPGNSWNVPIDDVLIGYSFEYVDGPDGVLGFAGPLYVRNAKTNVGETKAVTTISAVMKFDIDDFINLDPNDLDLVIIHEMGHALGIGSLWSNFRCGLSCPNGNQTYQCQKAQWEYQQIMRNDRSLLLEAGKCSHWAESSFNSSTSSELMTPYFESGKFQPITRVSLAALADLGYEVNMDAADPWVDSFTSARYLSSAENDILRSNNTFTLENMSHFDVKQIEMKYPTN